ncbi:MAG: hypothetical protein ACI8Z1_001316, partial [Candidatus Azotimanducaceae bacterium]
FLDFPDQLQELDPNGLTAPDLIFSTLFSQAGV